MLALVALSNQCCRHSLFDDVSQSDLAVFGSFLTTQRYMRLLVAKSTACLAAFGVLAAKLLVDVYWKTFHLEVTERALRQEV